MRAGCSQVLCCCCGDSNAPFRGLEQYTALEVSGDLVPLINYLGQKVVPVCTWLGRDDSLDLRRTW